MEQTAKKQWTKPELLVLVRSKPEEAVLGQCKSVVGPGGANSEAFACGIDPCIFCIEAVES